MSLLMKALEKAARDRSEARADADAASATIPRPEVSLALELLAADTPSPRLQEETRRETDAPASAGRGGRRDKPPHAATVMRTRSDAESGAWIYLRDHPVVAFGILAALFAIGFGSYVYLQIFHPALFLPQAPVPAVTAPLVVEPPKQPPAAAPQIATAPLLKSPPLEFGQDTAGPPAAPSEPLVPPAPRAAPPGSRSSAPTPTATDSRRTPLASASANPTGKVRASPAVSTIVVKPGDAAPSVNPALAEAYSALQGGRLEAAAQLYAQAARNEPNSIDALLGLAAIAAQEGRAEDALRHYQAILRVEPGHALAQSGVISLTGRADPVAAESQLKLLIARKPSAFLYFTLGNLYADQSLWAQAQQAYFQAHHIEPQNPEYAYNLAVGLEHISQPRLAAGFYRRAVELAATRPHVNFDPARARERIAAIGTQLEQ